MKKIFTLAVFLTAAVACGQWTNPPTGTTGSAGLPPTTVASLNTNIAARIPKPTNVWVNGFVITSSDGGTTTYATASGGAVAGVTNVQTTGRLGLGLSGQTITGTVSVTGLATNDQWDADIATATVNMATNNQWDADVATATANMATNNQWDADIATATASMATVTMLANSGAAHNARMDSITTGAASVYATQAALVGASNTLYAIATNRAAASFQNNLPAMFLPPGSLSFANSGRGFNSTPHRIDVFGTNKLFALLGLYHSRQTNYPDTSLYAGLEMWQYSDSTSTTGWMIGANSPFVGGGLHDGSTVHAQWRMYATTTTPTSHAFKVDIYRYGAPRTYINVDGDSALMTVSGRISAVGFAGDGAAITGIVPNAAMSNAFVSASAAVTNGQWNASVSGVSNLALAVGVGATNIANAIGLVVSNLHVAQGASVTNAQVTASNALSRAGGALSGTATSTVSGGVGFELRDGLGLSGSPIIRFVGGFPAATTDVYSTDSGLVVKRPDGDTSLVPTGTPIYAETHWASNTALTNVALNSFGVQQAQYYNFALLAHSTAAPPYSVTVTNNLPAWKSGGSAVQAFYGTWNFSPSSYALYSELVSHYPASGTVTQDQIGVLGEVKYNATNLMFGLGGTNWFRVTGVLNPW